MISWLKPSLFKVSIFLFPVLFNLLYWSIVVIQKGTSSKNITDAFNNFSSNLLTPGVISCMFLPFCQQVSEDTVILNQFFLVFYTLVFFAIWYIVAALIGAFIEAGLHMIRGNTASDI